MTGTITCDAARRLAIRYAAFGQACDIGNDIDMIVWGDMLLEVQEETGIELFDPENTRLIVSLARRRREQVAAVAAI